MKTAITVIVIVLAVMILLAAGITLGAGYYMYRFAILKRRDAVNYWENPIKPLKGASDEVNEMMRQGERFIKTSKTEQVSIKSFDGLNLSAHILDCEKPNAVVILVHGYRSNPITDFACVFEVYAKMNFAILAIDQRAHGYSEGHHIGFGATERFDIVGWAKYAKERWGDIPTVLDGVSMGAATVMMGGSVGYPDNVRAVIADCGYTTPGAIARKVLKQWFRLPPFPIYYVAKWFVKVLAKYDLDGVSARESLEKLKEQGIPVLIAHGRADGFVPYSMSEENMKAFSDGESADGVEFFSVEEADHGMAFLIDRDGYMKSIYRLFDKAGINYPSDI